MDQVLEILRPHLEPLARPFANPARPVESTSDLLQVSCLRAWKKIGSFKGGENDEEDFAMFRSWIGQIVRTLGLTAKRDRERLRRKSPGPVVSLHQEGPTDTTGFESSNDPPALDPSPSAHAMAEESSERLLAALETMPDSPDTAILRMRLIDGLNLREIADRLGFAYKTVWNRYQATIQILEKKMKGLE